MDNGTNQSAPTKVYVLELNGDPVCSGGSIIIEVGGVSLDKDVLERLKVEKDKELDEYFDDGDDEEEDEERYEWCYMYSDYSERPYWSISEYPLL